MTGAASARGGLFGLLACALLAVGLAGYRLGDRPLYGPAEVRYASVAREMLERGDWIVPRLSGVRYYEKPPLLYWATAASLSAFGIDDAAARLPSALAYVGTTVTSYRIAAVLLGPSAGPPAALVWATSAGPFLFGRFLFPDMLFVFCLSLSLLGLAKLVEPRPGGRPGPLLFWIGAGLAGLTKGAAGIVLPVAVVVAVALAPGDPGLLRRIRPVAGALMAAAIFLPWHAALGLRDPEFLPFYVLNEHVCRFLGCREPADFAPSSVTGFWLATALWFFPWALFLPGSLAAALRHPKLRLPLVWTACVVGFFTLARSRLEYYALPAFPALATLVAARWIDSPIRSGELRAAAAFLAAAGVGFGAVVLAPPNRAEELFTALVSNLDGNYREYFSSHPVAGFPFVAGALELARWFAPLLVAWAGATALAVRARRPWWAFAVWVVGAIAFLQILDRGHQLIAPDRSQKPMAEEIERLWQPGTVLVVAGRYYEERCGVTWYTGRATRILDGSAGDLYFGHRRGDASERFLSKEEFERLWSSATPVLVAGDGDLRLPAETVLLETPHQRLLANPAAAPRGPGGGSP